MNEHYRSPENRKREFFFGSIALLAAHLMPMGILVKRSELLPPIAIVALTITALAPLAAFFFTLRRNQELEEGFRCAEASQDEQMLVLLVAARADLKRVQFLIMSLNMLWATGVVALIQQMRNSS